MNDLFVELMKDDPAKQGISSYHHLARNIFVTFVLLCRIVQFLTQIAPAIHGSIYHLEIFFPFKVFPVQYVIFVQQ
jgi:hypothetical protein